MQITKKLINFLPHRSALCAANKRKRERNWTINLHFSNLVQADSAVRTRPRVIYKDRDANIVS